jgi:osmoprotectant transport system substrate-binding protein
MRAFDNARRRPGRGRLLTAGLGVALLLTACGGGEDPFAAESGGEATGGGSGGTITVASLGFTEAQIMASMYVALLEDAGLTAQIQEVENRELSAPALESGELDVSPEYAATAAEFYNRDANGPTATPVASPDIAATITALKALVEPRGLTVLEPAQAANQNAFVVTEAYATEFELETLTDLGESGQSVVLAATEECPDRPFCLPALRDGYGITVSETLPLGFGTIQGKEAVRSDQAQLGLVGTTDGTLESLGLVLLDDDKNTQLAENLVPLVNSTGPGGSEQVATALNSLAPVLTTEDLAELNRRVDQDRELPEAVATAYLTEKNLIGA